MGLGVDDLCEFWLTLGTARFCWFTAWCAALGRARLMALVLEVVGALLGRFYFLKRYGGMWRQYAPVLLAGFSCGMGLAGMFAMGCTLIMKSLGQIGVLSGRVHFML